ncbi:MAG: hypothetical protein R3F61_30745 [Myxococcota bacterium]
MAVTTWYFIEDDQGRVQRTPVTELDRFFDGDEVLPHASGAVRACEVTLSVRGRRVQSVHRVLWLRFAVDGDGRCDLDARAAYAHLAVVHTALVDQEADVVPLGPAIAGERLRQEHAWQPTAAHLADVGRVLNSAAVRAPVVAIDATDLRIL